MRRHDSLFAHPVAQESRAVAHFGMILDVRAAVGQTDYGIGTVEDFGDRIAVGISMAKSKDRIELFLHRQIEKCL